VEVLNCAVATENGTGTIMFRPHHPGGSSLYREHSKVVRENVRLVNFADIIRDVGHVNVLKMDCEGAEYDLISYAYKENVLRQIENVIMEVHGSPKLQLQSGLKPSS
jgi:FkbM family methyltransferase